MLCADADCGLGDRNIEWSFWLRSPLQPNNIPLIRARLLVISMCLKAVATFNRI